MFLLSGPPDVHPVGIEGLAAAMGLSLFAGAVAVGLVILVACFLAGRRQTGTTSFVGRAAQRLADRDLSPAWGRLPLDVVLAGLAVALLGWTAATGDGPFTGLGAEFGVFGLAVATLGGVSAGAVAHPPAALLAARPPMAAHRGWFGQGGRFGRRTQLGQTERFGRLGQGPVGAALVVGGGVLALVAVPIAAFGRAVDGVGLRPLDGRHVVVLAGVLAMAVGAWLLHAEARRVTVTPTGQAPGIRLLGLDVREVLVATSVLLALSAFDLGGMFLGSALSVVGALVLVVARFRLSYGAALAVVGVYAASSLAAAVFTGTLSGVTVPALTAYVVAASVLELVAAIMRGSIRPSVTEPSAVHSTM